MSVEIATNNRRCFSERSSSLLRFQRYLKLAFEIDLYYGYESIGFKTNQSDESISFLPKETRVTPNRRTFLAASACAAQCFVSGCSPQPQPERKIPFRVSLNLAGAEFGADQADYSNENPGRLHRDFTFNSRATVQYFVKQGVRVFRIPIAWERIQPILKGPLNSDYLGQLLLLLSWMKEASATAIIDLHNYGRYRLIHNNEVITARMGEKVDGNELLKVEDLVDLWLRLSEKFKDNAAVLAWGIMNEPHDMGSLDWGAASNQVVQSLRESDDSKWIMVSGDAWSSALRFPKVNGEKAWINDPLSKTIYEAHAYFDSDASGKYTANFDQELKRDPKLRERPQRTLRPFLDWCRKNDVLGYVGEMGVPSGDARWLELLQSACSLLKKENAAVGYWAAGEWWKDYPLSVQPKSFDDEPSSQLATILSVMSS